MSEDIIYEYDGTNPQYLLPTEEDKTSKVPLSKTGVMDVEEPSLVDRAFDFVGEAVDDVVDYATAAKDFVFGGLGSVFEHKQAEPINTEDTILSDIYKSNIEWGLGRPLPSEKISEDKYHIYLEYFNQLSEENRITDASTLATSLIEQGVPSDTVLKFLDEIKHLPAFSGFAGLAKEGQKRDVEQLLADDPETARQYYENRAGTAYANARLLQQKAAEDHYRSDTPVVKDLLRLWQGGVVAMEALPFADKLRTLQMSATLDDVFKKYGAGEELAEDWYVSPTSFYEEAGAFIYDQMTKLSTTEFEQLLNDIDVALDNMPLSSGVVKQDFWTQVMDVEYLINKLSWAGDIASLIPPAAVALKGAKAVNRAKKVKTAAESAQKAAKAAGHTVETVAEELSKVDRALSKASTVAETNALMKDRARLESLARVVSGEEVAAADSLLRTAKGMSKTAFKGTLTEVAPAVVLATRGAFLALTSPLKSLKAIGDYARASRILGSDLLKNSTAVFRNTDYHLAAINNALSSVTQGYGAKVVKDGVNLAASPEVRKATEVAGALKGTSEATRETMSKVLHELTNKGELSHLTEASLSPVKRKVARDLREILGRSKSAREFTVDIVDSEKGAKFVTRISKADGTGYKTKETAMRVKQHLDKTVYADSVVNTKLVQNADGFHIDVERMFARDGGDGFKFTDDFAYDVAKTEFVGLEKTEPGSGGLFGYVTDYVKSIGQTATTFQRSLFSLFQHDQGVVFEVMSALVDKIERGNRRVLNYLINRTRSESKWLDRGWLRSIGVDDKTLDAYDAYITLSDSAIMLHKRNLAQNLVRTGKKDLLLSKAGSEKPVRIGIGGAVDKDTIGKKKVFILDDVDTANDGYLGKSTTKIANPDDYNFYRVLYSKNMDTNYIAVKKSEVLERGITLDSLKINYIPGRMLFTPDSGFIKQIIRHTDGSIKDIRTLFAHPDRVAVAKAAKVMEEARQIAIKYDKGIITAEKAAKSFENIKDADLIGFTSFEEFYNASQGADALFSLNPDDVLQAVRDGEVLKGLDIGEQDEFFNFKGASFLGYSTSEDIVSKRMRKSERIFNPFTLGDSPRLTPTEEIATQIHTIMNNSTKAAYERTLAEDMVRVFSKTGFCTTTEEAKNILRHGASAAKGNVPADLKRRFDHMHRIHSTLFGTPTSFDLALEDFFQKIAHYATPDYAGKGGVRTSVYYGLRNFNPVRQMQGLAFHWYLGMLNPRQLYKQASAIFSTSALSPVASSKALALGLPFMMYSMTGGKKLLKTIATKTGMSLDDLEDLSKIVNRLDVTSRGSYSGALEASQDVRSRWKLNSTFFYDTGERVNRYFSALVTAIEKGKKYNEISEAEWVAMITRQNNLYFNMGRAGMAPVQASWGRVVTQFQGWSMRWLETLFDRQLTPRTKSRLLLSTLLLSGTAGAVGRTASGWLYNFFDDEGVSPDINMALALGFGNVLVKSAGGDIHVGEFFEASVGDLFIDTLALPSVSAGANLYATAKAPITALVDYLKNRDNEDFSFSDAIKAQATLLALQGKLPSGINKSVLTHTLLETGIKYNSAGMITKEDVDTLSALAFGAGFRSIDDVEEYLLRNAITNKETYATDVAKQFVSYLTLSLQHPENKDAYLTLAKVTLDENVKRHPELEDVINKEVGRRLGLFKENELEFLVRDIVKVYDSKNARKALDIALDNKGE